MNTAEKSMIQALVSVAWSDGHLSNREQHLIGAVAEYLGIDDTTFDELRQCFALPERIEHLDLSLLTPEQERLLVEQAVLLSFIDGDSSRFEALAIQQLLSHLKLSTSEADEIVQTAVSHAKRAVYGSVSEKRRSASSEARRYAHTA